VEAGEQPAQVAMIGPTATVADLAKIFHRLKVNPTDIIAILQALQQQGALKARIKVQ
jgi:flagellar P-ring protein FlgI